MSNFETWWEREGQEFLYALNTTTDDDIKLVAEFAWKNGAYCAEQAEQEPVAWALTSENGEVLDCISHTYKVTQPCTVDYDEPLYAAPVRTKDLTDDEERQIIAATVEGVTTSELAMFKAVVRAAIAAFKEKNK